MFSFPEETVMKPVFKWVRAASLIAVLLALGSSLWAQGAAPAGGAAAGAAQNPGYTTAEYNAYVAAKNTADPQAKIKALDGFVMQYNTPALMGYIYQEYYTTYLALKNYPKTL